MSHALYVFGGLLFLAGISSAFSQTGVLNDTGQTQCDNGSNVLVTCTSTNTGDASAMPRQDARFGRDAAAPVQLGKTGTGQGHAQLGTHTFFVFNNEYPLIGNITVERQHDPLVYINANSRRPIFLYKYCRKPFGFLKFNSDIQ